MKEKIVQLLSAHRRRSLTLQQLSGALGLDKEESTLLARQVRQMQADGLLIKTGRGRYGLPRRLNCLTGVLDGNRKGFAFLRPDLEKESDVFISPGRLKGAVHGDRVLVRLLSAGGRRSREGEVVDILSRGCEQLVGTLEQRGRRFYVVPDDRRFGGKVNLAPGLKKARCGEKVIVKVDSWQKGKNPSCGHLVERIGMPGVPRTEQLLFEKRFELPGKFPPSVFKELDLLPSGEEVARIAAEERRADLRNLDAVTIDGAEAKDYDDAISLEMLPRGGYRLGVHIADVSHYVREGKAVDREARERSTSTYLVDRAVHMLPSLLSEDLCSLKAGEDRLSLSVLIDLSAAGEMKRYRFSPAVVRVARRLTYPQVEAYLEAGEPPGGDDPSFPGAMLERMDRLAALLRQKRLRRGALDLDIPEPQFILDPAGAVLRVERRRPGRSESLIEEFMILANEVVAAHFAKEELPVIYRVHAVPAEEKLAALRETLLMLGDPLAAKLPRFRADHLKMLLEGSRGRDAEVLIRYLILRSLPQARYSTANEGHFGLASRCYCHFTAPIRRYPDLVVHRILKESLKPGGLGEKRLAQLQSRLPAIADHASERERAALEAERADEDIKKAEYMKNELGQVYPGIINGVTGFGLFVELENTVEGMIPLSELADDYYVYQERLASVIGERTRKTYRLGDPIKIKVIRVDTAAGKITFGLAEG